MNESGSKIKRFSAPRHSVPQSEEILAVPQPPQPAAVPTGDVPLSERPDSQSIAAQQTYRLQQQINAQSGGRPRYGAITGNDVVAKTARLQQEIEQRRLHSQN